MNPVSNHRFVHLRIQHHRTTAFIVWFLLIHLGLDPLFWHCQTPHGTLNPSPLPSDLWASARHSQAPLMQQGQPKDVKSRAIQLLPWSRLETCRVCLQTTSLGMPTTRCRMFMVTEGIKVKPQPKLWTLKMPTMSRSWSEQMPENHCNTSRDGLLLPKEAMECLHLLRHRGWGTGWKFNRVGISEFADHVRTTRVVSSNVRPREGQVSQKWPWDTLKLHINVFHSLKIPNHLTRLWLPSSQNLLINSSQGEMLNSSWSTPHPKPSS